MNIHAKTISGILLSGISCSNAIAEVVLDGSTGSSGDVNAINQRYEITSDLGRQEGGNLYHSFQNFNVETDHTANFSGPTSVNNIISRVTGGEASHIDGTISSSITGANLYLLNPSGVLFGANASIDVSGAFHVSTADYLRMGEDDYFYTNLAQDSSFVAASPTAFGFTNNTAADIKVDGSSLSVDDGQTISIIGGDINLDNGADLQAKGGSINIASVASSGVVKVTPDTVQMDGFTDLGDISLTNTSTSDTPTEISTSGGSAGHIVIRGGTLTLDNGSRISANTVGSGINNYPENIDIDSDSEISLKNLSSITSDVEPSSSADTKGVALETEHLIVDSGSSITSNTAEDSTGSSGGISIDSDQVTILDGSKFQVQTNGSANSGDINLVIEDGIILDTNSLIESTVTSSGDGGNINVDSEKLDILGHSAINVSTSGAGNSGDINIESDDISIKDGGRITTSSRSAGITGNITVGSDNLHILGPEISDSPFNSDFTGISSVKNFSTLSEGGNITIVNSENLTLDRRAIIETRNSDASNGGYIVIDSNNVDILRGSQLVSYARRAKSGNGGDLIITTNELNVVGFYNAIDSSIIYLDGPDSRSIATGDTGNLTIATDSLNILNGGRIRSNSRKSTGATGNVNIHANNMLISGLNTDFKNQELESSEPTEAVINLSASHIVVQSFFSGRSEPVKSSIETGMLSIDAGNLVMDSHGYISTKTRGYLNSPDLHITTNNLELMGGAYLSTSATQGRSNSNAGNISIIADDIVVDGSNDQSVIAGIYSETNEFVSNERGGNIHVESERLYLTNNAIITSETSQDGTGGDIFINSSENVQISNGSIITTKASNQATGNAGNVNINTNLFVLNGGKITTTAISGQGGDINIAANNIIITNNSTISAASEQSVDGTINITNYLNITSDLVLLPDDAIDVASQFKDPCDYNNFNKSRFSVSESILSSNTVTFSSSSYSIKKSIPTYHKNAPTSAVDIQKIIKDDGEPSLHLSRSSIKKCS